MNQLAKAQLRWMIGISVLAASTLFWLLDFRFASFPFLVSAWVLLFKFKTRRGATVACVWAIWLALSFSPVDVFPFRHGGPPRLVPLVMGLPKSQTAERAERGEVILGGCIVSGFEPKYYLVIW
jgi:hypothetical protein